MLDMLQKLDACPESIAWVSRYESPEVALAACKRGDWMLWYAARSGVDLRRVVFVAAQCARVALSHVPPDEDRPRLAIEAAEAWARGEMQESEVRSAAIDAVLASVQPYGRRAAVYYAAEAASYAAEAAYYAKAVHAFLAAVCAAEADAADSPNIVAINRKKACLSRCAELARSLWP